MENDAMGFPYPKIDENKCIDCGACEKVCSFNDQYERPLPLDRPIAYAVRHKDLSEVMRSRSGAAFVAISDEILLKGGIVYGAGYDRNHRVIHKRATNKEERDDFRGSKYVQSDLGDTFKNVKEDLKAGLWVLFSGTPCQTAGLFSFIGKQYRDKLILVDIVCHGVPSPYIWKDYLSYQENKYKDKIVSFDFRDKQEKGWRVHFESFVFSNGSKIYDNLFKHLFYSHIILRNSCTRCPFSNLKRPSDLTIADFWGWEKSVPDFNKDDKGINLLLCNTEKGEVLFNSIKSSIDFKLVNLDDCLQPNLVKPSKYNPKRAQFEDDYVKKGFRYIAYRYGNIGLRYNIGRVIRRLKKIVKGH